MRVKAYSSFSGLSLIGGYSTSSSQMYSNIADYAIEDNATVGGPVSVSNRTGSAPSSTPVADL